mmetsp:Transcript_11724/g.16783  ORF Transcript_11724/g.16783 Transcript_11724/m.16783 type:complete len:192 (+) Transcript_11724:2-577(+)
MRFIFTERAGLGHAKGSWEHEEPISNTRMLCSMQAMVRAAIGDYDPNSTKVIGFKEIRHDVHDLDFFIKLFPCGKFIINIRRDVEAQKASKKKNFVHSGDVDLEAIKEENDRLVKWAQNHNGRAFLLPLEEFTVEKFNSLAKWLGVRGCEYGNVSHANSDGYGLDKSFPEIKGNCTLQYPIKADAWEPTSS